MPDYPPVYVLRHGETEWNAIGRLQGYFDSPLTQRGVAQAEAQRSILAARDLKGFVAFSSPQGRAFHTASLALAGFVARIDTDPRLGEIGVGAWAGRYRKDLVVDRPLDDSDERVFDLYERAPGGEGFTQLASRCRSFLDDLSAPSIIVTHGITSRMLRLILLGKEVSEIATVQGGQGVVYHISKGRQVRLANGA